MAAVLSLPTPTGAPASIKPKPPGDVYSFIAVVTCDASYPTGGYPILAAQVTALYPTSLVEAVDVQGVSPNAVSVGDAFYNYATGKLQLLNVTGAEMANTTDVHTITVNVRIWAR